MFPARGDGDGNPLSWYFQAFVLWWLSLEVCCASSESQSSSGRISASVSEERDHGPFSNDVLASLTLFLSVLLNPAESWDVRPTPGVSAFTSRAGASLSFVFLTPLAAHLPPPPCVPGVPGLSLDPVSIPEFREKSGGVFPGSRSQSVFLQVPSASPPAPPCWWLPLPGARMWWLPSHFRLSSHICARFHGSPLHTSILSAGDVHL